MQRICAILLTCLTVLGLRGQGIEFFHGTWEEALLKARQEDRIIFVDAFTTWCGPCRNMAANTFPNEAVGEFFNANFISMKMDMEKEPGLTFRQKFPVSAYPTLLFIDADEKLVQKSVGAKNPTDLIKLAESVVASYDKSYKYAEAYAAGDRSYALIYNYVAALNKAGKPTNKIANEYIATQSDLTTPDNLRFLLQAATQVDCQCFTNFEKYMSRIAALAGQEAVDDQVRKACNNTVKRAIEFESPELLDQAGQAMQRHLPKEADSFSSRSEIQYALALHDIDGLATKVDQYVRKFAKNDPALLHQLALDLEKFAADDSAAMAVALDIAGKAAKSGETKYILTYARLTYKLSGPEPAVKILDEALERLENKEGADYRDLAALRTKIQNS